MAHETIMSDEHIHGNRAELDARSSPASGGSTTTNNNNNDTNIRSDSKATAVNTGEADVVEEKSAAPQAGPSAPPDGGLLAWLQVAAGTSVFISTWGLINTFGTFQSYYGTVLLKDTSNSSISWIGTLQTFFILGGSVWSGPLTDWGYGHVTIIFGSFMVLFGLFMTSLCYEYWQFVLAQGLVIGIGMGSIFAPTTGIINTYFAKKRGLALGIVSSGSVLGGVILPIVFARLINRLGFGWTVRVMAFILLATLILPVVGIRQRIKPAAVRRIWDKQAMKEPDFTLYALSLFITYLGVYVPFFYIELYALEQGLVGSNLDFYLLPILNATSCFGRIGLGHLADKIGAMTTYSFSSLVCAILIFGWTGIKNEAGVIVFVVLYGFFSSAPIVLPNLVTATNLTPDMRHFGVRLTMQLIPSAIGLLIGNPIAGAILPRGWIGLQLFAGFTVLAGAIMSYAARILNGGWNPTKKV